MTRWCCRSLKFISKAVKSLIVGDGELEDDGDEGANVVVVMMIYLKEKMSLYCLMACYQKKMNCLGQAVLKRLYLVLT